MKYRKKPVVIDAYQFTREMAEGLKELPDGVTFSRRETAGNGRFPEYMQCYKTHDVKSLRDLANYDHYHRHYIKTLKGDMDVRIGDWVIKDVKGEFYPCKPDIFEQTYELVE